MSESPGVLIGLSNVLTAARARVPEGPDLDAQPALRERLHTLARRALEGRESYIHDAVLLGRRVRLFTNSHHLADFWRDNFHTEGEWRAAVGGPVAPEPVLSVFAPIGVDGEPQASYASASRHEAYLFNTSFYGDLRACALQAFGRRVSAEGYVLHGGAVEAGGRGLVWIYPKEVIHPTPSWGFLDRSDVKFVADGWLFVEPPARVHGLEKQLYLRTATVASYPELLPKILRCKFENVPDLTPAQADAGAPRAQDALEAASRSDPLRVLRALPEDRLRDFVLRLLASPDARMMLDPGPSWGRSRILRSVVAASAVLLRAGPGEASRAAVVPPFPCAGTEIHVESVGGHPREISRLMARNL
jgi:hypothetical protein